MTLTIVFGPWVMPLSATLLFGASAVLAANLMEKSPEGRGILGLAFLSAASIASLAAWAAYFIWAALK